MTCDLRIASSKAFFCDQASVRRKLRAYKLVIADANVFSKYPRLFMSNTLSVRAGEGLKSFKGLALILKCLDKHRIERFDKVAVAGGGTLIDSCGFALSVYKRGISFDIYPTTLLAMCDASIGGKNSFNYKGKNVVGTFHMPDCIIICVEFIMTLARKEYLSGLAEIIKTALLNGRSFADFMLKKKKHILSRDKTTLTQLIRRVVAYKLGIVKRDPYDLGIRNILNYGHTIGHAIESASNYSIPHGLAVAKGMAFETYFLWTLRLISHEQSAHTLKILNDYGYDLSISPKCLSFLDADKKRKGERVCICAPVWE